MAAPAPAPRFLAADWGSTHLRLRLASDDPAAPVIERRSARGIAAVAPGGHREVFLAALAEFLAADAMRGAPPIPAIDAYLSGMVTSTLGWRPTPYLRAPVGLEDLAGALARETLRLPDDPRFAGAALAAGAELRLHFLPGVATSEDVMRGEEVEVFGLLPEENSGAAAVILLPGTHSKWIRCRGGRIEGFATVPTGDLFAALHRETLIARTLPESPLPVEGDLLEDFDRGVEAAARLGGLAAIFQARSLAVLEDSRLEPRRCSALLSGALIGGEIRERLPDAAGAPILVGGAPALRRLYLRALARLAPGAAADAGDQAERAALEGIRRLRRASAGPAAG